MSRSVSAKDQYDAWADNWVSWALKADSLIKSSQLVTEKIVSAMHDKSSDVSDHMMSSCAVMLKAMACECLLKGLWVCYGHTLTKGGAYKKIPGTQDHQLHTLAAALEKDGITTFTEVEQRFLNRLSFFIVSGRYPVYTKANVQRLDSSEDGIKISTGESIDYWLFPQDEDRLNSLLTKFHSLFERSPNTNSQLASNGDQC